MRRAVAALLLLAGTPLLAQRPTSLPARDRALAGAAAPVFSIGREEGESWELLSNVSGVDFDGRDNLYVLDAGNQRVLVFDARGRFVRAVAKKGGGPGELMTPTGLAVQPDGTIVVADLGRAAFSVFNADGSFRHNIPFDSLPQPGLEVRGGTPGVQPHPAGIAVFGSTRIMMGGPGQARPASPPNDVTLYVRPLALKGQPKVVVRVPRASPVLRTQGTANNRNVRSVPRAFSPQAAWGVLPDGGFVTVAGNRPDYQLQLVGPDGRTRAVLTRPLSPRKPTRADEDKAREQLKERLQTGEGMVRMEVRAGPEGVQRSVSTGAPPGGIPAADVEQQLRELEFAETVPVIAGVRTDPQGRIWVARTARPAGGDGPIDLIDASGRYIGTLAPQPLPDAISRSGLAAYIARDELGVEQVRVKRLPAWK